MTKGISNWIRTHTPIGRSKSEVSRPSESRANKKLEQTRQTQVTFDPHARDIKLELARREVALLPSRRKPSAAKHTETTPTAKHSRSPPKPSEPPPRPVAQTDSLESKIVSKPAKDGPNSTVRESDSAATAKRLKGFGDEINAAIGDDFEDAVQDLHAALVEGDLNDLMAELERLSPSPKQVPTSAERPPETVDPNSVLDELMNEVERMIPTDQVPVRSDVKPELSPETEHVNTVLGDLMNELDHMVPKGSDIGARAEKSAPATRNSVAEPKPRELRRRHLHREKSVASSLSPERRGVVTRHRPNTTPKTHEE
jgi:hypothetical protein